MNAPTPRYYHTAVWTGSVMVVWGGADGVYFNSGGRYDPLSDTWAPTSTTSAPEVRAWHTAVWTGSLMVIWEGFGGPPGSDGSYFNTGGRYDPAADCWTPTSTLNAPEGRFNHTAVWTGSRVIVWGGAEINLEFNTGGRYDPATDTWKATMTANAPEGREKHTAVWTGA